MQQPDRQPQPPPDLTTELRACWRQLPDKWLFLLLLLAWSSLFHFWGITAFNLGTSPSLILWLYNAYNTEAFDSSHGQFIPFIVLMLLWGKRHQLQAAITGPCWQALLLLAFVCLMHVAGFLVQQQRLSAIAFYSGVYCLIGLVWGWKVMKTAFFPFFLFAFAIPLGAFIDPITFPLRQITTTIAAAAAHHLLDIPLVQHGTQLIAPNGAAYEVAAACSGIRSFMALLAITTIYAALELKSLWKRAFIVALTVPLALLCNTLRLISIFLAAQAYGEGAGMWVHSYFSYVTYAVAIIALMFVGRWLRDDAVCAAAT